MSPRIKLLLLVGILVLPTVVAYLSYGELNWRPSAHKNYGNLLSATHLLRPVNSSTPGIVPEFDQTRGKWVMVFVGPSACPEACVRSLYYMRQTRILQDTERYRVELAWALTDTGNVDKALLDAVPGLRVWRSENAEFIRQFPVEKPGASHIYMVDPQGNLMLRFPAPPDAKRMTKDIKLLLRASQIG